MSSPQYNMINNILGLFGNNFKNENKKKKKNRGF
jgi:hypothetical protein